jgi:hypothetical protein
MRSTLRRMLGWTARTVLPARVQDALRYARDWLVVRRRYALDRRASGLTTSVAAFLRPRKTVLFYPKRPLDAHVIFKLCALLGYGMTATVDDRFDVAFNFMRGTHTEADRLRELPLPITQIVNFGTTDVSKRTVQAAFRSVFRYDLEVDPTTYHGPMVEKSDNNAWHDGRVVEGPMDAGSVQPDRVYQRVIRNMSSHEGLIVDHRAPIYGDVIPLVYLKYRPVATRFQNTNSFVEIAEPGDVFTAEERGNLVRLARTLGIECGEFDVLRDVDGRIYVVDAANTPAGPPNGLPEPEAKRALARLATTFAAFLERRQANGARV